jgi:hypothetical protein
LPLLSLPSEFGFLNLDKHFMQLFFRQRVQLRDNRLK